MSFRPSILERCILKVSTSSVAVGTDDLDSKRSGHVLKRMRAAEHQFIITDILIFAIHDPLCRNFGKIVSYLSLVVLHLSQNVAAPCCPSAAHTNLPRVV